MGLGAVVSSIKVKGKVASGYTVAAGEYVVATYTYQSATSASFPVGPVQVWYAPGDSVASTQTIGGGSGAYAINLLTAICFINSP